MSVALRSASPSDARLILALIRELAEYERLAQEVDATEAMIASALFGLNPRVFCDIAEWQSEAAGFALWFYSFSTFRGRHGIYLEDLFVRPAFRGKGLGKGLFAALARRCVAEGLSRLEWSVLDWNEPALGFYRTLGAQAMNGWTRHRLSGEALSKLAAEP
jgi:GNAT superfamily N-acetyltransferase